MSYSLERVFRVTTTPRRILDRNPRRFSWDITNISAVTVYYMRGTRGRDLATSGEAQGVPISSGAADGYDEEDAVDEVWVIAGSDVDVIVHQTIMPRTWEEVRMAGSRRTSISGRR